MAATMTMKMFLSAIAAGEMTDELMAFAAERLEKETAKTEARKTSEAALAKVAADEALVAKFLETATPETAMTASEIGTMLGITTPKATVIAKKAVDLGRVTVGTGKGSGGRAVKTYIVIG